MEHQEIVKDGKTLKIWQGDFVKLEGIETTAATPSTITIENVKKNILKGLPKIEKLPEYQKIKGHEYPIALVGGGPNIKKVIHELRDFHTILVAGSAHDYVLSQGIIPTYAAICDPDPISVNYYKHLHPEVKYLISTGADEKLINHFLYHQLVLWHCHSADYNIEEIEKIEGTSYHGISGGCTVGLRAINIALMLGYTNLHFFGYDSCMSDEECHAYEISAKERDDMGRVYNLKLREYDSDNPSPKVYKCLGYQLAQAHAFKEFYLHFGRMFTPTFHGEGFLADLYKLMVHTLGGAPEQVGKETQEQVITGGIQ